MFTILDCSKATPQKNKTKKQKQNNKKKTKQKKNIVTLRNLISKLSTTKLILVQTLLQYSSLKNLHGDLQNSKQILTSIKSDRILVRFRLISLFNGISTFVDYLMPKLYLWKNRTGTI